MKQRDVLMLMDGIAPAIAGLIGKALAPVLQRLEATERDLAAAKAALADRPDFDGIVAREVAKALAEQPPVATAEEIAKLVPPGRDGADGVDGKDGAPGRDGENGADGRDGKDGAAGADGKDGRDGIDGKSVTMADVAPMIEQAIASGFAVMPVPKDGAPGRDGRDGIDGKDGADGRDGEKGLDGKDGRDGVDGRDGIDGAPGRDGIDGARGADGRDGKDGVGLAGVLKDHEGCLVFTLTDGSIVKLAHVDGRDGEPGKDGAPGRDVDFEFVRAAVKDEVQRQVTAPLAEAYKGVWKPGAFKHGDVVTWGGSIWLAKRDTEDRPESSDAWTLIVKKGRDGKDGEAPKGLAKVKL